MQIPFLKTEFGINVKQAEDDADVLIVQEAINLAATGNSVVVIGEDTDLIVLLLHYFNDKYDIEFLRPRKTMKEGKSARVSKIQDIANRFPEMKKVILVFHALSGCDTTSSLYGKGKKILWKIFEKMSFFKKNAVHFTDQIATWRTSTLLVMRF